MKKLTTDHGTADFPDDESIAERNERPLQAILASRISANHRKILLPPFWLTAPGASGTILSLFMTLSEHLGYGRFQLEQIRPGEYFARFDGSLGRVCDRQRYKKVMPDHVMASVDHHTANARKLMLHRTARVFAITAAQAQALEPAPASHS